MAWTADPEHNKPGRDLGYTRYDKMARRWTVRSNMTPEAIRRALPPSASRAFPAQLKVYCCWLLRQRDLPVVGTGLRGMKGSRGARRREF
jgi:hypothetical protein